MPPVEPQGSLYVGDLAPEVTEHTLFELFQSVGPVASVKVCRDRHTNNSLGYAYVNFHNLNDAERAMDTMNFTSIRGRSCRIMWVEKDKNARDKGVGNIFIKNLDASIDHKTLFDTFSMFGSIKSCKVSYDKEGNSLGYGFVHYTDPKCAEAAIEKINGMVIAEKKVEVVPYKMKTSRSEDNQFSNVFVKNFPLTTTVEALEKLCKDIGEVTSFACPKENGALKGFFYCNFADHETAVKAIEELNDKEFEGVKLMAVQHKSRTQRMKEVKPVGSEVNIYVKNFPLTWTDEMLAAKFEPFGAFRSAKVMLDNVTHGSRGFGFVVFENNESASKAMAEMNGNVVEGKELYVALAQTKDQRKAALAKQYASRSMGGPGMPGMMLPHMMPGPYGRPPMMMPGPYGRPMMPPMMMQGLRPPPMMSRRPPMMPSMKAGARGLDIDRMLGMDSKQQKQELGERLYPLVQRIEPKLAGKITGMLLEMDTTELMMLVESGDDLLIAKVNEAVQVLKNHA